MTVGQAMLPARGLPAKVRWPVVRLREVTQLHYGKGLPERDRVHGDVPVYGSNGQCGWHDTQLGGGPTVVLGRKGQGPLGVEWCDGPFWVIDTAYFVTCDLRRMNLRYLYYATKFVGLNHLKDGTSNPSLSRDVFLQQGFPVPPLRVQREIVERLRAYDDLVENCVRRIRVLDEMARALYREWFVLFRYPGHEKAALVDSPVGRIPKGWEVASLNDGIGTIQDGDWIETKDQGGDAFRLLQISNVGVGAFVETGNFRYVTAETFARLRCTELVPGDLLVARMPTPIGRAWLVTPQPWRMITAVDGAIVRADPSRLLATYLVRAWNDDANLRRIAAQASGTTRPRVTRRELAALLFLVPPLAIQQSFERHAAPMSALVERLRQQADQLRRTRDLLLPRLLSGQLSVENAE